MSEERDRIFYLDVLRLFAALCVVFMHTAAPSLWGEMCLTWLAENLACSLAFTAVPLFFMISGYLMLNSSRTRDTSYLLRKRLPRLAVPLFVWSLVEVLWRCTLEGFQVFPLKLLETFYTPIVVPFWFMYCLILFYILSPFLYGGVHGLDRNGSVLTVACIALVSLQSIVKAFLPDTLDHYAEIDLVTRLGMLGGNLLNFILGYYLGTMERKIPNWILLVIAGVSMATITVGTWVLRVETGVYDQVFQDQSAGLEVLLAACLFLLAKQNLTNRPNWLRRIPAVQLLLPVYFMHGLTLEILGEKFELIPMRVYTVTGVTLGVFLLCLLVGKCAASVKFLCFPLVGISYQQACSGCNWQYTQKKRKKQPQAVGRE